MIKQLTAVLFVYALLNALLLGLGVAIGFGLHALIPSIDTGICVVIGMISTIGTIYFYVSFLKFLFTSGADQINDDDEDDDEDEDDEEEFAGGQFSWMPLSRGVSSPPKRRRPTGVVNESSPPPSKRKRRR